MSIGMIDLPRPPRGGGGHRIIVRSLNPESRARSNLIRNLNPPPTTPGGGVGR